jgi:restriction system protein
MARRRKKQIFDDMMVELAMKLIGGSTVLLIMNIVFFNKNGLNLFGAWLNPLLILIIIVASAGLGIHFANIKLKLERANINEIDQMSGGTFERYLEQFFKKRGWKVQRTGGQGDYGADLILESATKKVVVQAKRWKQNVGYEAIQQAYTSKDIYKAHEAWVITNSYFTEQARDGAKKLNVTLWDRDVLIEQMANANAIATIKVPSQEEVAVSALEEVAVTVEEVKEEPVIQASNQLNLKQIQSVCSVCRKPVLEKVKMYCLTNSSRFQGKIYCYDHQRLKR